MSKKGIIYGVAAVLVFFGLLGSCMGDSEYERAGKEFGTWSKKSPSTWTDTQKKYYNNFSDWAAKN